MGLRGSKTISALLKPEALESGTKRELPGRLPATARTTANHLLFAIPGAYKKR